MKKKEGIEKKRKRGARRQKNWVEHELQKSKRSSITKSKQEEQGWTTEEREQDTQAE